MHAPILAASLALSAGLMAASGFSAPSPTPLAAPAAPAAPAAHMVDDAVAAAVIVAIRQEFDEEAVDVTLGQVASRPAGLVQRDLSGAGRLRLGNHGAWIPFRFSALFDASDASIQPPRLSFDREHAVRATAPVAAALRTEVGRRMRDEFAQQAPTVRLDQVRVLRSDQRFLQLVADGSVDFAAEGRAHASVQGTLDRTTGRWVRVDYALGDDDVPQAPALAVR